MRRSWYKFVLWSILGVGISRILTHPEDLGVILSSLTDCILYVLREIILVGTTLGSILFGICYPIMRYRRRKRFLKKFREKALMNEEGVNSDQRQETT